MTTNATSTTKSPLHQIINALGMAYLVGMLLYLALRLILGSGGPWWLSLLNALAIYTFAPLLVLLPVVALFGLWRLTVRLGLLGLLAVVWFGPFFQPQTVPPPTNTTLEVITLNVWGDNNEQLPALADWLRERDADVVLLQEVPTLYQDGITTLNDLYPEQVTGRLLTLSRYPVVETTELLGGQQRLILDVDGQRVVVYNVHLAWPLGPPPRIEGIPIVQTLSRYDDTQRDAQIERLIEQVQEEELPYIVGGDFNMSQHSLIYGSIAVEMEDSFRQTGAGLGVTWPRRGFFDMRIPLLRLDYVWYGNGLRAVTSDIGVDVGSDHLPYSATFELPVRPALEAE